MKSADDPSSPYFRDPNAIDSFRVKLYTGMEIVLAGCEEHGLTAELHRPEINDGFLVLHVRATKARFRAAQIQWITRMTATLPRILASEKVATTEPELC